MPEFTFSASLFHSVAFWAQCLGFLSYGLGVYCFYQKGDRKLKITMLVFNANHTLHFLLLEAHTSVIGTLLSGIRTALSIKTSSRTVAYVCIFVVGARGHVSYIITFRNFTHLRFYHWYLRSILPARHQNAHCLSYGRLLLAGQ